MVVVVGRVVGGAIGERRIWGDVADCFFVGDTISLDVVKHLRHLSVELVIIHVAAIGIHILNVALSGRHQPAHFVILLAALTGPLVRTSDEFALI